MLSEGSERGTGGTQSLWHFPPPALRSRRHQPDSTAPIHIGAWRKLAPFRSRLIFMNRFSPLGAVV